MKRIFGASSIQRLVILSLALSLAACSNNSKPQPKNAAEAHKDLDLLHQELVAQSMSSSALRSTGPTASYNDSFLQNFCSFAGKVVLDGDMVPYFSDIRMAQYTAQMLNQIQLPSDCKLVKKSLYDFPTEIAEYLVQGVFVYVEVNYDSQFKLNSVTPLVSPTALNFINSPMKTRDGVQLTTYAVTPVDGQPRGTILMRSPYMQSGRALMSVAMARAWGKNIVLQANRGTYTSEGQFGWIDPVEMNDGEDAVNFITQQPYSNGKVVAFGVSYPGTDSLAAAGNNPKGLVGVVACSAPASAATDSFTSGKFVEFGLFSYVTNMLSENFSFVPNFSTVASKFSLFATPDDRLNIDDLFYAKNSAEWDITNKAVDDINDSYWTERSLYPALKKTTVPILHVGGLLVDQDGRDTLLAYRYLAKEADHKNNHFLAVHQYTHGCGDTVNLPIFQKFMALADDNIAVDLSTEAHITHYHGTQKKFITAEREEDLPREQKTLGFSRDLDFFDFATDMNSTGVGNKKYGEAITFITTEDMVINGSPELKLTYTSNAPETPLHLSLDIKNAAGKSFLYYPLGRTNIITEKVGAEETQTAVFPMLLQKVPKGSTISLNILSVERSVFVRWPASRAGLTEGSNIKITAAGSELILPVER